MAPGALPRRQRYQRVQEVQGKVDFDQHHLGRRHEALDVSR
jgi:hypothetical protein